MLKIVHNDEGERTMELTSVGGSRLPEWNDMLFDAVKMIAADEGCDFMTCKVIRSGWEKILTAHGFETGLTPFTYKVGDR